MEIAEKPLGAGASKAAKVEATGSFAEGVLGAGAATVAILGLLEIFPLLLASIAVIAIGAALFLHGGAMSMRYSRLAQLTTENKFEGNELGTGMTVETIGGIAGIALGILALIGILPMVLIASAIVVFGVTLIMGAGGMDRMNTLVSGIWESDRARRVAYDASQAGMSVQVLVGLGAVTLGILSLIGVAPLTLALVALLSLGAADFLTGTTAGASLSKAFSH